MSRSHTVSINLMRAISQIGARVTNAQLQDAGGEEKYSPDTVKGRLAYLCREGFLRRDGKGEQRHLYITPMGLDLLEEPENALWSPDVRGTVTKPEPERVHVAATRRCLRCSEGFESTWPGHRICQPCRELVSKQCDDGLPVQWEGAAIC